ncbi:hypothetical protein [Vibrio sp. WXL210]|uniref:hypothetical protein n=1 Tax=Vibrio sp. WXL210 TaxID=3450709 RepID=UPI003EC88427
MKIIVPITLSIFLLVVHVYYPNYQQDQQLEKLKSEFHDFLFEDDNRVQITEIRVEDSVIALDVRIVNIHLMKKDKSTLAKQSRKILPQKICSSTVLKDWLSNNNWISIDVYNSGIGVITNVSVTKKDCV